MSAAALPLPEVVSEQAAAQALGVTVDQLRALWIEGRFPPPVGWLRGNALFEARHIQKQQTAAQAVCQ